MTSFKPPRAPVDDESNKAIFVNGTVAFGYTGISEVNGERTDLWLARVAALEPTTNMGAISRRIRDEATAAFARMQLASRYKRHAFEGAGWFTYPDRPELRPGIVTIQNALTADTQEWLPYARPTFELSYRFPQLRRAQFHLTSVGLTPSPAERVAIARLIRKCVHRQTRRQATLMHALVHSMRWLHNRYQPNSPIGPNLMFVSLPKAAAQQVKSTGEFMALAGQPVAHTATFLDVNASGRVNSFGPHVVFGGLSITDVVTGTLPSGPAGAAALKELLQSSRSPKSFLGRPTDH